MSPELALAANMALGASGMGGMGGMSGMQFPNFTNTPISGATGGPVSVGGLNAPPYPFASGWPASGTGSVLSGNAFSVSNGAVIAVAAVAGLLLLVLLKKKG